MDPHRPLSRLERIFFRFPCLLFLLLGWMSRAGRSGEGWEAQIQDETANRITQLITALDAPPAARRRTVNDLVAIARGRESELALRLLHRYFETPNQQAQEGVIEVLARVGHPSSFEVLAEYLRFTPIFDLRRKILHTLPIFRIPLEDASREEILAFLEDEKEYFPEAIRTRLRRPPFDAKGRFQIAIDRIDQAIEEAISGQLDPIEAAIDLVDSTKRNMEARLCLLTLCGRSLGDTREEWQEYWRAKGIEFHSPVQPQLDTLRILACRLLALLGVEATPATCERLKRLGKNPSLEVREAALRTMGELCEASWTLPSSLARSSSSEEMAWWQRKKEARHRLLTFARATAIEALASPEESLRIAAYHTLGSTRDPQVITTILAKGKERDESPTIQTAIAVALGKIGGIEAVKILGRYALPLTAPRNPAEAAAVYRRIWTSMESLGKIAGEFSPVDGTIRTRDPEAGRLAFQELLLRLGPEHIYPLPGASRDEKGQSVTLQYLALQQIQRITGLRSASTNPSFWLEYYHRHLRPLVPPSSREDIAPSTGGEEEETPPSFP